MEIIGTAVLDRSPLTEVHHTDEVIERLKELRLGKAIDDSMVASIDRVNQATIDDGIPVRPVQSFVEKRLKDGGTPAGVRDWLEQQVDKVVAESVLSEYYFSDILTRLVSRAAHDHPESNVEALFDFDGSIMPLAEDYDTRKLVILRPSLPFALEVARERANLQWANVLGSRTLSVVPFSTRPKSNILFASAAIERTMPDAGGHLVDHELALSTRLDDEVDAEHSLEHDPSLEEAYNILSILKPDFPSLNLDVPDQQALYSRLQNLRNYLLQGVTPPESETITAVTEFLGTLDVWTRGKLPMLAQLLRTAESRNAVIVYVDDGETPDIVQHERLYTERLRGSNDRFGQRWYRVDSRYRDLNDESLAEEHTIRPDEVQAILLARVRARQEAQAPSMA